MTTPPIMSITDELIAELEAAANAATAGPWNYDGSYVCTMRQEEWTVYVESWNPIADALLTKNVHYIAKANPATIKALLAHIVDLKQQLTAAGITAENCEILRADANRYQWLRDNDQLDHLSQYAGLTYIFERLTGDALDDALDEFIARKK